MPASQGNIRTANPPIHPIALIGRFLDQVRDESLQSGIVLVLESVDRTLRCLDKMDLEPLELDPRVEDGLGVWPAIEANVSRLLEELEVIATVVGEHFPISSPSSQDLSDLDLELALEDLAGGIPSPVRDPYELRLDLIFENTQASSIEGLALAIADLGVLIKVTYEEHQSRLSNPYLRRDGLSLLDDIHELCCRSERMLETLVAAVIRGIGDCPVASVFPRYLSGGHRAAKIRAWSVDIAWTLNRLGDNPPPDELLHTSVVSVNEAAKQPELGWLRSADRHEFQSFRRWLRLGGTPAIAETIEYVGRLRGWANNMRRINNRAILLAYDIETAERLKALIDSSFRGKALTEVMEQLYGRDERFDDMIRDARDGLIPQPKKLLASLEFLQADLRALAYERLGDAT